jgi:2-pyrone-4,6-dicarboxylate lactonase
MLQSTGLQRAVIVQPDLYADNRVTEDVLRAGGEQWRGIARLFAGTDSTELRRLSALGFRGIRLDGRDPARLSALEDIATMLAPIGWHVQLHLYARDLPILAERLKQLPVPVVLDHFARIDAAQGIDQPGFIALLDLLRAPHIWVKLSATYRLTGQRQPYRAVTPFARALIDAAPDRVLWGSDWPHSSYGGIMPNDGALLDIVANWAPDPATRTAILRDNPATLYFQ